MMTKQTALFLAAILAAVASPSPGTAADYPLYKKERRATTYEPETARCGRCGCPIVTTVRHPITRMAYPASFDPRERDEPIYLYGGLKTFHRYERTPGNAACAY